jgi:hypothetical protein
MAIKTRGRPFPKGVKTGTGRRKGIPNKATVEAKEFCREFLASPDYATSAKARVLAGSAPHLETLWWHYAHGKPRETVAIEGGNLPLPLVVKLTGE